MRWSLSLGRVAGIRLYVHFTFFLLLAYVALGEGFEAGRWEAAVEGLILFGCLAVIIVLHEFGHAMAAKYYGIRTRDITLLPIGGVARLERMPDKPVQELVVALAGPAVNVVLAAGLFAGLIASNRLAGPALPDFGSGLVAQLFLINVGLAIFNMIPAFPMDGGRVLRALLALGMDYVRATRIAAYIGQGIAILFAIAGIAHFFGASLMLVLIAVFVWTGAQAEAEMVRTRSVLAGVSVARLMATQFYVLRPVDPIGRAAEIVQAGFQHDFPVLDGDQIVGMLTKKDLLEALAAQRPEISVSEVMRTKVESVQPRDTIETALSLFQTCDCQSLPVTEGTELVGMLTIDRVGEYLMHHDRLPQQPRRSSQFYRGGPGPRVEDQETRRM
jgi:Zn-dependent protease/CBS domain-containing protein